MSFLNLSLLDEMHRFTPDDLVRARLLLGVSRENLGRLLGLNVVTIGRLERGQYPVPVTVGLSVRFLLAIAGVREFTFTKSPIVPTSRSVAAPVASAPAPAPQPAGVSVPTVSRPQSKKSGKNRKKKRRGF